MNNDDLRKLIQENFDGAEVTAEGDGYHHTLKVISLAFTGLSKVKRQQLIYQALHEHITSGELHAISIQALTPQENT